MKSVALFTEEIDDLERAVAELQKQCQGFDFQQHSAGLLFAHPDTDLEELMSLLTEAFAIPIMGVTASFIFTMGGVKREGISLHFFSADDCRFAVDSTGELEPEHVKEAMGQVYHNLVNQLGEKPKLLLTYGNPSLDMAGDDFVDTLDTLSEGVPVYGAMASDDFAVEDCRFVCNGHVFQYGAAVIAISGNIQPVMSSGFHVDTAIDYEGIVTRAEGNQVLELDGVPFVEALTKAGVVFNFDNAQDYLNTPFKISFETEAGEEIQCLRHLFCVDKKKGTAKFFGKIPVGAKLQVGILDAEGIHDSVASVVHDCLEGIAKNNPQSYHTLMVTSCASRLMSYTNAIHDESIAYVDRIPDGMEMSGLYAYGEACPIKTKTSSKGRNAFHNTTFSLLVM